MCWVIKNGFIWLEIGCNDEKGVCEFNNGWFWSTNKIAEFYNNLHFPNPKIVFGKKLVCRRGLGWTFFLTLNPSLSHTTYNIQHTTFQTCLLKIIKSKYLCHPPLLWLSIWRWSDPLYLRIPLVIMLLSMDTTSHS